jgi:EAL domain-containing protein (putative c-di-GMP-specific phosphodiesterase class I)
LRGRGTDGALIPPVELFTAAKQAGLLFQLDLAARRKAVTSIAEHKLSTLALINFTPTSIYDPTTCLRSTVATVSDFGLDPSRIVFEIIETEHADETLLKNILDVYRAAGFQVAIDDFGAGYSSMNLLNALHPDYLKLDMALVRGIDRDPYKAELARGLLDSARKLSIKTIAEGVETQEEWQWVRDNGADLVQGFYFARPGSPPPTLA